MLEELKSCICFGFFMLEIFSPFDVYMWVRSDRSVIKEKRTSVYCVSDDISEGGTLNEVGKPVDPV